jgi:hypothetical protein
MVGVPGRTGHPHLTTWVSVVLDCIGKQDNNPKEIQMSRIATGRVLADKFTVLVSKLTNEQVAYLRRECPLAFSLAEIIGQGLVTQLTDEALCVLENGVKNAELNSAIFQEGTYVMAYNVHSDEAPQRYLVKGVMYDGQDECYIYAFEDCEGLIAQVYEGDLDWDVQPCE